MTKINEKCAVFGVYSNDADAARLVHSGLWSLQHRGQESSGIASTEGVSIRVYKDEGLVAHVYDEEHLVLLSGHAAIGHNRYSTSGGSFKHHVQPILGEHGIVALAHNGNLPITDKLDKFLKDRNIETSNLNDSGMMHAAIESLLLEGLSLTDALKKVYPLFTGTFSLLVMTKYSIAAIRDSKGIRPLSIGKLNGSTFVISSETCALDTIGAKYVRDVRPGEMIVLNNEGMSSYQITKGEEKLDIFEFIYFARPDSIMLGKRVSEVRKNLGINLAKEAKVDADVVIPIPDSAIHSALGFAQESGIQFDHGLIKNRYIHRTFIRPAQKLREKDVMMKLNPLPEVIKGKRIAVVDDSIVRGTTSKKLVELLKSVGAKEIHFLISSPPVIYPDFYGIDIPDQKKLISYNMSTEEIKNYLEVESLHFLSYEGMIKATGLSESKFSTSCFSGVYPVNIGKNARNIKKVILNEN